MEWGGGRAYNVYAHNLWHIYETSFFFKALCFDSSMIEIGKTADQTLHNSLAFDFKSYLRYFQIETCTHSNFDLTLFHARGSTPQVQ